VLLVMGGFYLGRRRLSRWQPDPTQTPQACEGVSNNHVVPRLAAREAVLIA
jgi:hypothetical protein